MIGSGFPVLRLANSAAESKRAISPTASAASLVRNPVAGVRSEVAGAIPASVFASPGLATSRATRASVEPSGADVSLVTPTASALPTATDERPFSALDAACRSGERDVPPEATRVAFALGSGAAPRRACPGVAIAARSPSGTESVGGSARGGVAAGSDAPTGAAGTGWAVGAAGGAGSGVAGVGGAGTGTGAGSGAGGGAGVGSGVGGAAGGGGGAAARGGSSDRGST